MPARPAADPSRQDRQDRQDRPDRQDRRASQRARPRVVTHRTSARGRFERLCRVGLLCVLVVVFALIAERTASYLSIRSQLASQQAAVGQLARRHRRLEAEVRSLQDPATILSDARALGMVRPGERTYWLSDLPNN
jgi:cell division protein FtsB